MSIMPGIETRAPERTETSSGLRLSPKRRPTALLDAAEGRAHLLGQVGRILPVVVVEGGADLGGDGEARRHRQADRGHLGEVGALAAEQVAHLRAAFVVAGAEAVHPLGHRRTPFSLRSVEKSATRSIVDADPIEEEADDFAAVQHCRRH